MATSKELRLKIRRRYDGCYNLTGWDDDVLALLNTLDAEDAEETERQAPRIVGLSYDPFRVAHPTPVYERPPDDEGEGNGP